MIVTMFLVIKKFERRSFIILTIYKLVVFHLLRCFNYLTSFHLNKEL